MYVCVSFSVLNILGKGTGTVEAFVAARFDLMFSLDLRKEVQDGQGGSHSHNLNTWEGKLRQENCHESAASLDRPHSDTQ